MLKKILVISLLLITQYAYADFGGNFNEFGPIHAFQLWVSDPYGYFGASDPTVSYKSITGQWVDGRYASPPTVQSALMELGASQAVLASSYLKLNQSTPQSVINGAPIFSEGLQFGTGLAYGTWTYNGGTGWLELNKGAGTYGIRFIEMPVQYSYTSRLSVPVDAALYSNYSYALDADDICASLYGYFTDSGNTAGSGHGLGGLFVGTNTITGEHELFGGEGRVNGHSGVLNQVSNGLLGLGQWSDPVAGNTTTFQGITVGLQARHEIFAYDQSTPRLQGSNIGIWVKDGIGGLYNYGILVADQTGGTNDYGVVIAGADTYALWIGQGADNTDAANGITFGASFDTNLYRGAANQLKTDDALYLGSNLTMTAGTDIRPSANSTTAINIAQADGTDFVTFDSTNKNILLAPSGAVGDNNYIGFTGTGPRAFIGYGGSSGNLILQSGTNKGIRFNVNNATFGSGTVASIMYSTGDFLINSTDDDGTPATGKLVVKGSTNDGSTNIFVGRDSDEANVATLDTDGNAILSGSETLGGSTGVKLSAASGVLTMAGIGGTYNDSLIINLESQWYGAQLSVGSGTIYFGSGAVFADDQGFIFGDGSDCRFQWETTGSDSFQLGLACGSATQSGYYSIMEQADLGVANRSPSGTSVNPVLRIYSNDATIATPYIEAYHNNTNGVIATGLGDIILDPAGSDVSIDGNVLVNTTTTMQELTVNGDQTISDTSPNIVFRDSSDNTAYCFHLDTATSASPYQGFTLWKGTDTGGLNSFAVNPDVPLMRFDSNNYLTLLNRVGIGTTPGYPFHVQVRAQNAYCNYTDSQFSLSWLYPTIGIGSYLKNTGSESNLLGAHGMAVWGHYEDVADSQLMGIGTEGKVTAYGTGSIYGALVGYARFFNAGGTGPTGRIEGLHIKTEIAQSEGGTAIASGVGTGVYVEPIIGGASATKYAFLGHDKIQVSASEGSTDTIYLSRTSSAATLTVEGNDDFSIITPADVIIDPAGNDLLIDATGPNYAADAQANDDYAITITGITLKTGMVIYFKANTANTGACTLNLNAVGAVALKAFHDQDPPDNYIEAGSMVQVIYDGSVYQILSPDANP